MKQYWQCKQKVKTVEIEGKNLKLEGKILGREFKPIEKQVCKQVNKMLQKRQ